MKFLACCVNETIGRRCFAAFRRWGAVIGNSLKGLVQAFSSMVNRRLVSALLIVSILSLSTPSAPKEFSGAVRGGYQYLAFYSATSGLVERIIDYVFPAKTKQQETQESRDSQVVRFGASFPETASTGSFVQVDAIPYDANDIPVSGVRLMWEIETPEGRVESEPIGILTLKSVGQYNLRVEGASKSQGWTIDVVEQQVTESTIIKKEDNSPSQQNLLPFEDWNPDNIVFAGHPRNQRGETPGKPKENSNFSIAAPVISVPGRAGLDLNLSLSYNSRVWTKMGGDISYDMDKDPVAPGWGIGFGKLIHFAGGGIVQFDGSGSKKFFAGSVKIESNRKIFEGQSNDGSFIKARSVLNGSVINGQTCYNAANATYLKYPDGSTIGYTAWYATGGCITEGSPITMVPTSVVDKHGNVMNIFYHAPQDGRFINYIKDTLGRIYTFNYTQIGGKHYLTSITAPGLPDPNTSVVTERTFVRLNYKDHTLAYNFDGLNPKVRDDNNSIKVLSAIYYPSTNTGYWFGDSDSYSPYGMIRKVEEQRGMSFNSSTGSIAPSPIVSRCRVYSYPENTTASIPDVPEYTTVTETWDGMPNPSSPAITTYAVDWDANPRTTTITLPYQAGKTTEYSFNKTYSSSEAEKAKDGITYKTEYRDRDNVLRSIDEVDWGTGTLSFSAHNNTATYNLTTPRPMSVTHSEIENNVALTKKSIFDVYGPFNRVLEMHEVGFNNETLRKTVTQYTDKNDGSLTENEWASLPRLINLKTTEDVFDGANNRIDHTQLRYDVAPIFKINNVIQNYGAFCQGSPCPAEFMAERGNLSNIIKYNVVTNTTLDGLNIDGRTYDSVGNVVNYSPSAIGMDMTFTTYASATGFAYPEMVMQGSGNVPNSQITTSATYNYNTGLPLTVTDANQKTASSEYDSSNWRLKKSVSPTGAYAVEDYDDLNRAYTQTGYSSGGEVVGKQITRVNGLSLPYRQESLSRTNQDGTETFDVVETEYDDQGRTKRTSNPFKSNENSHGVYWSEIFYDSIGRVEKSRSPDGSEKNNYYDEVMRPSVATLGLGHTFRIKDPTGREKWHRTDADGNVAEVVEPNPDGDGSVSTNGLLTKYSFDRLGQLVRTEQGVQERKFRYDSMGRITAQKMAETNSSLDVNGTFVGAQTGLWSDVFTYDEMSNVKTSTDARGVKTTYSYQNPAIPELIIDPLNRLFSVTYETNGAANVLPSPSVKFEYQPTGNVSQVTGIYTETAVGGNPQRVVTNNFLYDLFGRITEKKTTLASRPDFPMATNYVYDSLNRVTDEYYPAQYGMGNSPRKNINHTFDQVGRRSSLKVDNVNYASSFVYNNLDQVTSVKIGPAGANQITEQYDYNLQSGNLQNQKVLRGSATLLDLSYQYQQCSCSTGGSGQITGITDNLNRNKDRLYEYDKLSRLKKVTGGLNQTWSQGYTYDRFGNRLSVTALGFEALRVQDQATSNKKERDKIIDDVVPKSSLLTKDVLLEKVADLSILNRETENESKPSPLDPNKQSEQTSTSVNLTTPGTPFDFDGDSKADYSTWNRSVSSVPVGTWTIKNSQTGQNSSTQLGASGNQIAPADYDGDGKTDIAIWNPNNGLWTIKKSSDGSTFTRSFGQKGDAIVPADYDGDGKADVAVWRPSSGEWYITRSSDNSWYVVTFGGQQFGDVPIVGDYDGDGSADITVWRPTGGTWYVYILTSATNQVLQFQWGIPGDVPVASDYDGDHKTDLAVWRPSTGVWYVLPSTTWQYYAVTFGGLQFGDIPVSADYDGDGKEDIAVYRPSTGVWYITQSSNGQVTSSQYGTSNDIAVPSAYRRRSSAPNNQNKEIPRDGHATLAFDATSNRITTTGFEYDLAGNQTRAMQKDGSALRFQYDAAGRMVKVKADNGTTIATYTYGIGRERVVSQDGDENSTNLTYYAVEGGSVISEYSEGAGQVLTWVKNYIYLGGSLLATQTKNGSGETVQFNHADQLGTRIVTDPGTGTSFEQNTLPFGTSLDSESTGSTNRRFTTYDRSASTGLDYANNRYYDSQQGRFATVDPIKMGSVKILSPQTLNLYAYVTNDPINKVDPSGLDGTPPRYSTIYTTFPTLGGHSGGTGTSIPNWLGSFLTGILGNLFGGGHSYAGTFGTPTYFWQLDTATATLSAPPPLPGAGTTANVSAPPTLFGPCDIPILKKLSVVNWTGDGAGANNPYVAATMYDDLISALTEISMGGIWLGINEAYRPFSVQQDYWNKQQENEAAVARRKPKPYRNILAAAFPGTSNHGGGTALDIDTTYLPKVLTQGPGKGKTVKQILEKYGFSRPASTMARKDYPHWQHKSASANSVEANRVAREYYENCL